MPSLLSDDLLGDVIATGHADVLVGLPTHNNARTAGVVARTVLAAFSGPFVRERTVLLNLDGHSTDGTQEEVRSAALHPGDLVSSPYTLRTIHRITAPYHGVPGRTTALRVVFAVAELMRARAVIVLDPTATSTTPDDVARWIRTVMAGSADYVKPVLPRAGGDGPLITQIVRPLFRAACGVRLLEPLDTQLGCSGQFAANALAGGFWDLPEAEVGVDAFLTTHALTNKFRIAQVATAATARVDAERRPGTAEVFQQVMSAVFTALSRRFQAWSAISGSAPVPTEGALQAPGAGCAQFDVTAFTDAFRTGLDALAPLLASVLDQRLLEALWVGARATPVRVDDTLWAQVVLAFQAAAISGVASPRELAQMLEPLYLGRTAAFLDQNEISAGHERLESLALAFEEQKPAFVESLRTWEKDHAKRDTAELARSA